MSNVRKNKTRYIIPKLIPKLLLKKSTKFKDLTNYKVGGGNYTVLSVREKKTA